MTTAFVLGNGLSRKGIPPDLLKNYGKVYGCNALYREFVPDVLVATDRPIATHIQLSGYSKNNKFYTRRPVEGQGALAVPKKYFGYSSGPIAVSIAALDGHQHIYMLGFDMGPDQNNQFNNIYAGTEFYKPVASTPTYTGNWIRQILQILEDFPQTNFYRITGVNTAQIPQLETVKNLKHQDLNSLLAQINNQKDI